MTRLSYVDWLSQRAEHLQRGLPVDAATPRDGGLLMQLGWCSFVRQDLDQAAAFYERAAGILASGSRAQQLLGCLAEIQLSFVLLQAQDGERALQHAEHARSVASDLTSSALGWRADLQRATALLLLGRVAEAIDGLIGCRLPVRLSRDEYSRFHLHAALYTAYTLAGQLAPAAAHYALAQQLSPTRRTRAALAALSTALAKRTDVLPNLLRLQRAAVLPGSPMGPMRLERSVLQWLAHDCALQMARAHRRRAVECETRLWLKLARVSLQLEDAECAIQSVENLPEFTERHGPQAALLLGAALCARGDYAQAAQAHLVVGVRREGEARALELDGMLFQSLAYWLNLSGDYWQVIGYCRLSLETLEDITPRHMSGEYGRVWGILHHTAKLELAEAYRRASQPRAALKVLGSSLIMRGTTAQLHWSLQARQARALARLYHELGCGTQAGEQWRAVLRAATLGADAELQLDACCGLGQIDVEAGNYVDAIVLCRQALSLAQREHDWQQQQYASHVLGTAYAGQREYASATTYLLNALRLAERLGDRTAIANTLLDLALALRAQDQALEASFCLERAHLLGDYLEPQRAAQVAHELGNWHTPVVPQTATCT